MALLQLGPALPKTRAFNLVHHLWFMHWHLPEVHFWSQKNKDNKKRITTIQHHYSLVVLDAGRKPGRPQWTKASVCAADTTGMVRGKHSWALSAWAWGTTSQAEWQRCQAGMGAHVCPSEGQPVDSSDIPRGDPRRPGGLVQGTWAP